MSDIIAMPLIERAKRTAHKHTKVVCFPRNPSVRKAILAKLRANEDAEVIRASR